MKIDAQQKKFFLFSAFVVIAGVLIPSPAKAIFGIADIGLFDIPLMQLDALDFIDNVVMRFLIFAFVLFAESQVLVITAGAIVGWASSFPVPLGSDLVQVGWRFMVGFVNLALLIIFLAIAFSSILRLETFQMRKTLPKLIVVALLVNFSLLFVGVFVDIAQVLINTLKDAFGGGFVTAALAPLKAMWAGPLTLAVTALGLKIGLALVPIGNVVSAVGTGSLFIADLAFGQGWFLQLIVLTIFNFVAGLILLLFAFLFVARTVVISLLAIVAPLALAASVLPSTQKYWSKWLGALISWSLVGVVALFLMGLGMKLAGSAIDGPSSFGPLGLNLSKNLFGVLFLLTYLVVVFIVSKKLTAMGTDMIIAPFRQFGGAAVRRLGIPAAAETWRRIGPRIEKWGAKTREEAEALPKLREGASFGERVRFAARSMTRIRTGLGTPVAALAGQATQQMNARDQRNVAAKRSTMQHRNSRDLLKIFNHKGGDETEKMAVLAAMVDDNQDADDLQEYIKKKEINGKEVWRMTLLARDRLGPSVYRSLIKALAGFIYTEPETLGIDTVKDESGNVVLDEYGSPRLQDKDNNWAENVAKREIIEKATPGDITTKKLFGNFFKKINDPEYRPGGEAIMKRGLRRRGGDLLLPSLRMPETPEGRHYMGALVNDYVDTNFGEDPDKSQDIAEISFADLDSFANIQRVRNSQAAWAAGMAPTYRGQEIDGFNREIRQAREEASATFATDATPQGTRDLLTQLRQARQAMVRSVPGQMAPKALELHDSISQLEDRLTRARQQKLPLQETEERKRSLDQARQEWSDFIRPIPTPAVRQLYRETSELDYRLRQAEAHGG